MKNSVSKQLERWFQGRTIYCKISAIYFLNLLLTSNLYLCMETACMFSNLMLRDEKESVLINLSKYFGITEFYSDAAYDWVKIYFSIVGNYDQFNIGEPLE